MRSNIESNTGSAQSAINKTANTAIGQSTTTQTTSTANTKSPEPTTPTSAAAAQVRTLSLPASIPNTSLFKTHPESGSKYLVETDPQFANYKTWLSTDYMLQSLNLNPTTAQKRLGDGFYEQKLIREQVAQLTGQRFLGDYQSDDQQFQALMNNGLTFAKAVNLRPGIALSDAQVAQLTSDMVWLVEQTVTLADGSQQAVLVPQVYVRVRPGDLDGSGALLAGKDVNLKLSGDLTNSGTIAGRCVLAFRAGDGGFAVNVQGKTDLVGGQITSTQAAVDAGKNSYEAKQGTTTTDLQNTAAYSANSVSVGLGAGSLPGKSASAGMSGVGFGSDKASASSTTTAGISGVAGNTAARTGDTSTAIKPIFDVDKVKKDIEAQVTITQEFNKQAGKAITDFATTQRKTLQDQIKNAATPEEKALAESTLKDVNMQERALNILVSGLTGMVGSVVTKEALSTAAEKMRDLMIEDSKKFPGVVDSTGKVLSNVSGPSEGLRGDGTKVGGTRVDLDVLCGASNERCVRNTDGSLKLDSQNRVQFDEKAAGMTMSEFEKTPAGQKLPGATGGIQGEKGTLFGVPYAAGSWQDKLIESFAGTHDYIGGKFSGLYDGQGNAARGRSEMTTTLQNRWSEIAVLPAAPFAAAEGLSPEVWKAIGILLGAGK